MRRHFSREETGQAMVLVALALVAVLAMLALVLDGGYGYLQRRRMQNAADAAAFAGTRQLATRLDDTGATELAVLSAVNRYAELNGVLDSNGVAADSVNANVRAYFVNSANFVIRGMCLNGCTGIPSGSVAVVVKVQATYDTFIADVIGFPTLTASAVAQGSYGSLGAASGDQLVPISVLQRPFVFDQVYTIWDEGGAAGPFDFKESQRGWIGLGGSCCSNSDLKYWMANGYPGVVTVDSWLPGDPGTRVSTIHAADDRIVAGRPHVIVPLYDNIVSGNYHISGFAAFDLITAEDKLITGKFVKMLVSHGDFGGSVDTGLTTMKLTSPAALP